MVQLKSYYSLCPLIDRLSFIGVSEDKDRGCAIVTLGKNVVNLYKLSDQKQISGWTSKEHITAPVIYDTQKGEYVGVFNETVIKTWQKDVQSLDKLRKKKFSKPILKLVRDSEGNGTIIFKDGDCASLLYAIESRKNIEDKSFVSKDETIVDVALFSIQERGYVCLILKAKDEYVLLTYELEVEMNTPIADSVKRIKISRNELIGGRIIGVTISSQADPPQAHVLWSDGRLFANTLREDEFKMVGHVPWISHSLDVHMTWIGGKHLAIYGADNGQEGAILAIYNTLFGVGTCSYPLKLFCKGARLWCAWEYLLLEATQHLAVVPFVLYTHRNMSGLIGTHKSDKDVDEILVADWGKGKLNWKSEGNWNEMAMRGLSEREICKSHFPALIEENKIKSIKASLDKFIDIPEDIIVTLLSYIINKLDPKDSLKCVEGKMSLHLDKDQKDLRTLLNNVLSLPFVKENMVSSLRKSLSLVDMLYLIEYIRYIMSTDSESVDVVFEAKLIEWCVTLIDSHYQQLVLSTEDITKNLLVNLEETITNVVDEIQEMQTIIPILNSLLTGKDVNKSNVDEMSTYYIEEITIDGL